MTLLRESTRGGTAGNGASGRFLAPAPAPLLLAPRDDTDAASLRSDQDSDSEDDELQLRARNSRELRAHDRRVFLEEDETDRLVMDAWRRGGQRRGSGLAALLRQGLRRPSTAGSEEVLEMEALEEGGKVGEAVTAEAKVDKAQQKKAHRQRRRQRRRENRERLLAQAEHGEDGALMYEMEEGGMQEGSSTGDSSEREDGRERERVQRGLGWWWGRARSDRGRRTTGAGDDVLGGRQRHWWLLAAALLALLSLFVLGAMRASRPASRGTAGSAPSPPASRLSLSNGTHRFAPTTILVSLDGFRADFLQRGLTPHLGSLFRDGLAPRFMLPSFPSVTFPNHWTLVTGLFPESHGIVGNTFWDPHRAAGFANTDPDPAVSRAAAWWAAAEPLWATAERAGIRTAVHMWPGSEADVPGPPPSILDRYRGGASLASKAARLLEWLDAPAATRPQLLAAYVPQVDADGHRFGPNSTEIRATLAAVDAELLGPLLRGLEARNLTSLVNVVVVSDHGMATTDAARLLQLDDLVDMAQVARVDGWPLVGLWPRIESVEAGAGADPGAGAGPDPAQVLAALHRDAVANTAHHPVDVYLRDVDMPARFHFSRNARIAPLWIVPQAGWGVVSRAEFDVAAAAADPTRVYHPRGLHGYDHEHPLMRAIFVARGPAFAQGRVEVFQNTEVYNLVCDSLGLPPRPNNGTLRLPLKTVQGDSEPEPEPADPGPDTTVTVTAPKTAATTAATATTATATTAPTATTATATTAPTAPATTATTAPTAPTPTATTAPTAPTPTSTSTSNPLNKAAHDAWDWIAGKVGDAWHKISGDIKAKEG